MELCVVFLVAVTGLVRGPDWFLIGGNLEHLSEESG